MNNQKDRIEAAIRHIQTAADIDPWAEELAVDALKKQADLQPTCNELATDCISRQDAIELIERMKPYHQEADDIAEMIANMPSAQPEHFADVSNMDDGELDFVQKHEKIPVELMVSSQPKPCEDAVSRQTLQKELALYPIDDITSEDETGYNRAINDIQKMVLHLPSAQPNLQPTCNELATDVISRQTAIDAAREELESGTYFDIPSKIEALPSAQPEPSQVARDIATIIENEQDMRVVLKNAQNDIVHCRDCKFCHKSPDWKHRQSFGESIWYCEENRGFNFAQTVGLDDYCSSAERRTDE